MALATTTTTQTTDHDSIAAAEAFAFHPATLEFGRLDTNPWTLRFGDPCVEGDFVVFRTTPGRVRVAVPDHRGCYHQLVPGRVYFEQHIEPVTLSEMPPPVADESRSVSTQVSWYDLPALARRDVERYTAPVAAATQRSSGGGRSSGRRCASRSASSASPAVSSSATPSSAGSAAAAIGASTAMPHRAKTRSMPSTCAGDAIAHAAGLLRTL